MGTLIPGFIGYASARLGNLRKSPTSPSVVNLRDALSWSSVRMSSPRLPRTSVPSALARRELATRDRHSTGSFPASCARVETLPTTTEPEASPYGMKFNDENFQ